MRVIGGKFGRRRLQTLAGTRLRPTSDPLRETLFNVLGASIAGATFADCYAGSGAVGVEALSRGAAKVFFIENYKPAAALIRGNLISLGVFNGYEILPTDALGGLEQLARRGVRCDFIFLDPPYDAANEYARTLAWLGTSGLLATEGLVIVEHSRRAPLPASVGTLERVRELHQGDSRLSFYRHPPA
jgi:16S rRNA (guanine(966)-N(2))-methyltransferase RsmD